MKPFDLAKVREIQAQFNLPSDISFVLKTKKNVRFPTANGTDFLCEAVFILGFFVEKKKYENHKSPPPPFSERW